MTARRLAVVGGGSTLVMVVTDCLLNTLDAKDVETAEEADTAEGHVDPVTAILATYPLNDTLDASTPLTEDELMREFLRLSLSTYH
jgi:hypothetical protein